MIVRLIARGCSAGRPFQKKYRRRSPGNASIAFGGNATIESSIDGGSMAPQRACLPYTLHASFRKDYVGTQVRPDEN